MKTYKKTNVSGLKNDELEILLNHCEWSDHNLLKEYERRFQLGKVKFKAGTLEEHTRLIEFVTRPPDKSK